MGDFLDPQHHGREYGPTTIWHALFLAELGDLCATGNTACRICSRNSPSSGSFLHSPSSGSFLASGSRSTGIKSSRTAFYGPDYSLRRPALNLTEFRDFYVIGRKFGYSPCSFFLRLFFSRISIKIEPTQILESSILSTR